MPTNEELRTSDPPSILDNTMRTMLVRCPLRFYFFLRGFDYKKRPLYFSFGEAWHQIQRRWRELTIGTDLEPGSPEWRAAGHEALKLGLAYWDRTASPDGRGGSGDTRDNLETMFREFVAAYPQEPWSWFAGERGWTWPLLDAPARLGLARHEYYLAGSMDGLAIWEPYGRIVVEDKTVGAWLSVEYLQQYDLAAQVTGYIWRAMQDGPLWGALINVASKRKSKDGTTPRFARLLSRRDPAALEHFLADVWLDFRRLEMLWDLWHWPRTTDPTECVGGIGKSPCLFKGVCLSGVPFDEVDEFRFPWLAVREGPWEPWLRGGEED